MDNLFEWIMSNAGRRKTDFPEGDFEAYRSKLTSIDAKFRAGPLKFVDQLACSNDGEFYTVHGSSHVEMVLRRCYELSKCGGTKPKLTGYEAFLLCVAVYAHDSAMLYSRKNHANNLQQVLLDVCGSDNLTLSMEEKRKIIVIARAHTSDMSGSRDTISSIPKTEPCGGKQIRTAMLAAMLRMADQLSDDRSRSAIGKVDERAIPQKAIVFHKFIGCVDSIICDFECSTVEVHLRFNASDLQGKIDHIDCYLWDFAVPEIMKWFREFFYCSRFTKPTFELRSLMFSAVVYNDGKSDDLSPSFVDEEGGLEVGEITSFDFTEKLFEHEFLLTVDAGYPFPNDPYDMCDALRDFNSKGRLDGEALAKELSSGT
ncbi:MAG: hypothetical protein ABJO52_20955 [Nisaea sp.]|uniref:HD domain-containing protein n=1 Tax=Nisaea sp. TaxID=2024842 RepID=UPI0032967D43